MKNLQRTHQLDHTRDVVRVVQVTDSHLCRTSGGTLLGMDTDHSLQAVLDSIQREQPEVDLVLATGDLSNQGAVESYVRFQTYMEQLGAPAFWLTGNHDSHADMLKVAADSPLFCNEIRTATWQILMLDTQVPGAVEGELGADQLGLLEGALEHAAEQRLHSLVCLHHQPIAIGCKWLDQQMVADADSFFRVLDRYGGVKGVLWGHIHQQVDSERKGVALMASPSTCIQFAPGSESFRVDDQSPGYRWLDLHRNGTIETGVSRVVDVSFKVDLDSGGYL
ncbi:MAG: 3',5'-cyclic-AMP phosphodiesterase [Halieaceae bacterium]|jgi:3',5'-cyclic-AMP phosphodiesterase|nr:3',5'-cyclic-AMP phosphodiesterase [Halieaceae bacterium]